MKRRDAVVAAIAVALGLSAAGAAAAETCAGGGAYGLSPCGLEVVGGEDAWHADQVFALRWHNPSRQGQPSLVAVHYRALDAAGRVVVAERRIEPAAQTIDRLAVPLTPGVYRAEVWLEDAAGDLGSPAAASLRFDDARPGDVDPLMTSGWIGDPDFPYPLRLAHPAGAEPLSGIRGYAVAVDRSPGGDPCAAADRCTPVETNLDGGAATDTLWLSELAEGTSYVHAVAVSGSGMRSATIGSAVLRVDTTPPLTHLAGLPGGWTNRPVRLLATASDAASGMRPESGRPTPFTAIRVDGGAPVLAAGDSVEAAIFAPGVHTVAYYARDAAGNSDGGGSANGHPNPPPRTATVRIDAEPPRIGFANAQSARDPEAIEARLLDPLSGPDSSRGAIAVRRAGSGDRFEPLPTSVEAGRLLARWDSDSYPPGRYEFRATGYDQAGNEAATGRRLNGSPMVLSAPLKKPTGLRIRLLGGPTSVPPSFDRTQLLAGRLTSGRRAPLAHETVRLVERFAAGSVPGERTSTVRTDALGGFSLRLRPGPSREIVATFPGTATLSRARSAPLKLEVRGHVRMRAAAVARVGGRPLVFRGRVGGPLPPGGKYLQLQFRAAGVPWTEFRTIRSDAAGRFRYAYRFSDDDSRGVRFEFRAYATPQDGWPYEAAASRPVAVRGL